MRPPPRPSPQGGGRQWLEEELIAIYRQLDPEATADAELSSTIPLESLKAAELKAVLESRYSVTLSLPELLEGVSIADLADQVLEKSRARTSSRDPFQVALHPEERHLPFPLTDIQQAYWMGRNPFFELGNVGALFYVELDLDDFDMPRAERALQRLIERHDMLRAVILPDGSQQILSPVPAYRIEVTDLSAEGADQSPLEACRRRMSQQVFSCEHWPRFELHAFRLPAGATRLCLAIDLLVCDAASIARLLTEWFRLYDDPLATLEPLELTFRDYVVAQKELEHREDFERSRDYWMSRLPSLPPAPDLPLAKQPSTVDRPRMTARSTRLDSNRWSQLKARAADAGLTPAVVLCAAYAEVLETWSASRRFTLNLPVDDRVLLHPQVAQIVGEFTSLILLEVDHSTPASFNEAARAMQAQLSRDLEHVGYSGVRVLRDLAEGSPGKRALMPVVFTCLVGEHAARALPTPVRDIGYTVSQVPQVSLENQVFEVGEELRINWDAIDELFPPGLIDDMFNAYGELLRRLADDAETWNQVKPVSLPSAQRERREAVNATSAPISDDLLHSGFDRQVGRRPNDVAVIAADRTLTYLELDRSANSLAHQLRGLGARPNRLVAVVMEKGWEQVVAAFGILRARAAYLPIDASLPQERIDFLLDQGQVEIAVTQSAVDKRLIWPARVRRLQISETPVGDEPPLEPLQGPDDLAYVIFTSGSTGQPKGVMIDHRGALNTVVDISRRFQVGPDDRVLALSSLSFDLSVYDIFGVLAAGGTVVIPEPAAHRDPLRWLELMREHRVTVWNSVPALMEMLVEHLAGTHEKLDGALRLVMLSGDWIPLSLSDRVRQWTGADQVISLGGATEASIWSVFYPIEAVRPEWRSIPYGKPLSNQRLHVLDDGLELCPDWVTGNLYIGGVGLARGYWRDPEKTAASFIEHPKSRERLYRTGDLARALPDGNIEFLGRNDFQVKVGGYRIELGEIESALEQHSEVRTAVALADGERGHRRLLASVVPKSGPRVFPPPGPAGPREPRFSAMRAFEAFVGEGQGGGTHWQPVFDDIYRESADPGFNTAGWTSSYTGEPIPADEMHEWVDTTVERIRALSPRRILEIGCGTGLLLRQLAPECERYVATDASAQAIERVRELLAAEPDRFRNVTALQCDAADLDHLPPPLAGEGRGEGFDLVLLNSVVQYFPNVDYAMDVLARAAGLLRPGGHLFVGDVRSLPLLECFHASVELDQAEPSTSVSELLGGIDRRIRSEGELALHPQFFAVVASRVPAARLIQLSPRRGRADNEMTRFRYDVIIRVGNVENAQLVPTEMDWDTMETLRRVLETGQDDAIVVRNIPNRRVESQVRMLESLRAAPDGATLGEVPTQVAAVSSVEPDELLAMDGDARYRTVIDWSAGRSDGSFDAIFVRRDLADMPLVADDFITANDWSALANQPCMATSPSELVHRLRAHLRQKLPEYMIPATIQIVEELPLTANGKVDRSALPRPAPVRVTNQALTAPRNAAERALAEIWSELLNVDRVGVDQSFFELGGDSLGAVQLVARAARVGIHITLRQVFEQPTIAALAAVAGTANGSTASVVGDTLPVVAADPDHRFEPFPLMPVQRAYLIGRHPAFELGNVPSSLYVELQLEDLDLGRAEAALQAVISHHDMLRLVVLNDGRQQVLREVPPYRIAVHDLTELDDQAVEVELALLKAQISQQRTNPERWPLFEVRAAKLPNGLTRLFVAIDLLVIDGTSLSIFMRDWATLCRNPDAALPELELSFRDYVLTVDRIEKSETFRQSRDYWLARVPSLPAAPQLPLLESASALERPRFQRRTRSIEPGVWSQLKKRAAAHGLTPSITLLAVYAEVLARQSVSPQMTLNVTISDRLPLHPQVDQAMGNFTSVVLLAVGDVGGTFKKRAEAMQRQLADDLEHRFFSGVQVLRELARSQGVGRALMPVVFTSVVGEPMDDLDASLGEVIDGLLQTPQVYLENQVIEMGKGLQVCWDAIEELFPPGMLDEMFADYCAQLLALADSEEAWELTTPSPTLPTRGRENAPTLPSPIGGGNPARIESPRNDMERALAQIWAEHLGVPEISIHDHYVELGGDSITALQIIAGAAKAGIHLTPRLFFEHPTVAQLAAAASMLRKPAADQRAVVGPVSLTPVQHWFFENELTSYDHWNYVFLFETPVAFAREPLEQALRHLLICHDALRSRFEKKGDTWTQVISDPDPVPEAPLDWFDLSGISEVEQTERLEQIAADLQRTLSLESGRVLRVAYFDLGSKPGRLVIIGHWLVWDMYSCHVFFEDLSAAYTQFASIGRCEVLAKTTSIKTWSERLSEYAGSRRLAREASYWLHPARARAARLPVDHAGGSNTLDSAETLVKALDSSATSMLIRASARLDVQINDLLLTAVARAVSRWAGISGVLVDLEGHGREDLFPDCDLSRTIGRVSTIFPVLLEAGAGDARKSLALIRKQLARVPQHGIGYGLLRYLTPNARTRRALASVPQAEIGFNYLGRVDDIYSSAWLKPAAEYPGPHRTEAGARKRLFDILAGVVGGQFVFGLTYSRNLHDRTTVERLAGLLVEEITALTQLASESVSASTTTATPGPQVSDDAVMVRVLMAWADGRSLTPA